MQYFDLAESLSELHTLTYLIKNLEITRIPFTELVNERFIKNEVWRIKTRASMDILLFGQYSKIYFLQNAIEVNTLIMMLFEITDSVPERRYRNESETCLYAYGNMLIDELKELSSFLDRLHSTTYV